MMSILANKKASDELRYSAIRYFAKYYHTEALSYLYDFCAYDDSKWEYKSISAQALSNYPCTKTIETLKSLVTSKNFYVRYNAGDSLLKLKISYEDLIAEFKEKDKYAYEILEYLYEEKMLKTHKEVN